MSATKIMEAHAAVEVWKQRDPATAEAGVKLDAAKLQVAPIRMEMQPSGDVTLFATGNGKTLSKEDRHEILNWLLAEATARGEEIEGIEAQS